MFSRNTTFITGAGASCHYGYPTGETLVRSVKVKAKELESIIDKFKTQIAVDRFTSFSSVVPITPDFILKKAGVDFGQSQEEIETQKRSLHYEIYNNAINATLEECVSIQEKLDQVDPPIIDHFLNRNDDLKEIGKLLIAWSILEKEGSESKYKYNKELGGNWCRYIIQHLMSGCEKPEDLLNNKVQFVTFNYDVSLERNLYQGLKQNSFFKDDDLVKQFFSDNRFIHVYGKIKEDPTSEVVNLKATPKRLGGYNLNKEILDPCYLASKGIRTLAPAEKIEDKQVLHLAKAAVKKAECVYIFGFGFDKENSKNIGLNEYLYYPKITKSFGAESQQKYKGKEVYFTNYQNKNIISKRASQVFYGNPSKFLPPNGLISSDRRTQVHYEMSTKTVYEALSDDFEIFD